MNNEVKVAKEKGVPRCKYIEPEGIKHEPEFFFFIPAADIYDRLKQELDDKARELQAKRDDALASRPYNVIEVSQLPTSHEFEMLIVQDVANKCNHN